MLEFHRDVPLVQFCSFSDLLDEIRQFSGVMLGSRKIPGIMFADDLVVVADFVVLCIVPELELSTTYSLFIARTT